MKSGKLLENHVFTAFVYIESTYYVDTGYLQKCSSSEHVAIGTLCSRVNILPGSPEIVSNSTVEERICMKRKVMINPYILYLGTLNPTSLLSTDSSF